MGMGVAEFEFEGEYVLQSLVKNVYFFFSYNLLYLFCFVIMSASVDPGPL